ncbi:MAG: serine/threonine-protein phosphatase [Firmicutes bacterium]|nr:serine/threonine-protein phosphatase [Bacillota bacterium]
MKNISLAAAAGVHIGYIRENNEDNFYFNGINLNETNREIPVVYENRSNDTLQLYAVCDGMGGEAHGELASLIATDTLRKYQDMLQKIHYHSLEKYIDMYINEVNNLIGDKVREHGGKRIGTTIALLALEGDRAHIFNIGDSRVYLLRSKTIRQISEDHTPAMRSVKMGLMTMEQAKTHPHRNKLTQYLGLSQQEMTVKPFYDLVQVKYNDRFLLCSDGLTDMVAQEEIETILNQDKPERNLIIELIDKALHHGGRDNITAIVITAGKNGQVIG